jgi:hypothetical protein
MAKSGPSEEEIIKLGRQIVNELQIDTRGNTLGIWMSHYLAELISLSETCENEPKRRKIKKECCEIIIQIWNSRKNNSDLPSPLNGLEPIIELLDALKKEDFQYPYWMNFRDFPKDTTWSGFINTVKKNSENIFELCFYSAINKELLLKKKNWIEKHKNLISKEELNILENLEVILNRSESFVYYSSDEKGKIKLDDLSPKERYKAIFEKIETEINEVESSLKILKDKTLKE